MIKEVWRDALKRNGLWVDVPDYVKPDCWVGYIKFEDRNKVIRRLSYSCRKPIEDFVRNSDSLDLDGFDREFALFLLDYTPRVVNLGFLTDLKRFGYSRKRVLVKCPICGGDMYVERDEWGEIVLYDRPPPGVPCLFRDGRGNWLQLTGCPSLG